MPDGGFLFAGAGRDGVVWCGDGGFVDICGFLLSLLGRMMMTFELSSPPSLHIAYQNLALGSQRLR